MKKATPAQFLAELHGLLSDGSYNHIISWNETGNDIVFSNVGIFETQVLQKHFKNKTANSFFRQLKLYGFKRTYDGRKSRGKGLDMHSSFHHDKFTKHVPLDLSLIRRCKSKSNYVPVVTRKPRKSRKNNPDFCPYDMYFLYLVNSRGPLLG
ncbi:hypothetical protein DSO57_1005402 [Entomophthora muscae]|uniref:Uncharacterized protein n=3 Tax=Entomophthora muscae TaxID=34485 RepID=A0ACC2RZ67_9FUNG|nr:hypothetical protein DSO57_1005393 [Entomophthora muscae]KAJ9055292.1 hypothetical protein DSO57_1005398 [Entomophthora muscae]KAJ9055296.1 hypothetical protein DSO57_1005402 [Entomophthora muscae]